MPLGPFPTPIVSATLLVAASTLTTRFDDSSLSQTEPPPTAMPRPTASVAIVWASPLAGSIRDRVRSAEFVTHSDPSPKATPIGPFPTSIVRTTAFVPGSICETVASAWLATQTAPAPTAIPAGAVSDGDRLANASRDGVDSGDGRVVRVR